MEDITSLTASRLSVPLAKRNPELVMARTRFLLRDIEIGQLLQGIL